MLCLFAAAAAAAVVIVQCDSRLVLLAHLPPLVLAVWTLP
jgi:hypothetical protein